MANLNKVMLIGRLTFDPDPIQISGSNAGAKFGFAVSNRRPSKQNPQQWEDVPVFIDVEIWNRGESKQGDRVLQTLRKGSQIFIEGHLKMDEWEDRNGGGKRTKLVVVAETFQYLESKAEGEARLQQPPAPRFAGAGAGRQQPARAAAGNGNYGRPNGGNNYSRDDDNEWADAPPSNKGSKGGNEDDIPF